MRSLRVVALLAVTSVVLFIIGCEDKNKTNLPPQEPPPAAEKPASFPRETIPESTMSTTPPPTVTPTPTEQPVATIQPDPEPAPTHHPKATKTTTHKPKEKYATAKKEGGKTYVIKKGDTLGEISQQFYGTSTKWKKIASANKDLIKDPNRLPVGAKIQIP